jgi:hypothetical protein
MHVVFLCLESNKYFFTILIVFVLGLTSQLEIIIVLSFALPDRHLTSYNTSVHYGKNDFLQPVFWSQIFKAPVTDNQQIPFSVALTPVTVSS